MTATSAENSMRPSSAALETCGPAASPSDSAASAAVTASGDGAVAAAVAGGVVKLGPRNCPISFVQQSAGERPPTPAPTAPTASAMGGFVVGRGGSCGPCHGHG